MILPSYFPAIKAQPVALQMLAVPEQSRVGGPQHIPLADIGVLLYDVLQRLIEVLHFVHPCYQSSPVYAVAAVEVVHPWLSMVLLEPVVEALRETIELVKAESFVEVGRDVNKDFR